MSGFFCRSRSVRRLCGVVAVSALSMLFAHGVLTPSLLVAECRAATDQERAGARSAAEEGIRAYSEGQHDRALKLLERAESIVHAPTHLLFIARSRAKLGKLVEAREAYIKVIQENLPASAPKAFLNAQSAAQEELPAVEARIPKLTIQVEPAAVEGLSIELDGAAISAALVGVPTPINPGEHQIVAKSPGQRGEARITLAEGERQEIQVQLKPDTATPATTPAAQNAEPGASQSPAATESSAAVTPQDASSVDRKTWGYVAGGAGIALVGVGATFAILAKGQLDDAESDPELCPGKVCSADGRSEVDSASTKAWIATAGFGVGAAALAASAYLLLTDDSPPTSTTARGLRVAPGVAREGGFVSVAGAF